MVCVLVKVVRLLEGCTVHADDDTIDNHVRLWRGLTEAVFPKKRDIMGVHHVELVRLSRQGYLPRDFVNVLRRMESSSTSGIVHVRQDRGAWRFRKSTRSAIYFLNKKIVIHKR